MRQRYIDIVKGLSILCIAFLHYEDGVLPQCVTNFIGSFMITAFYVSSGWLDAMKDSQRSLNELVKKRWKQLGMPYLWWTAIIIVFDLVLLAFGFYDLKFIGKEVYKALLLRGIGTLWFIPALFGGEVIWHLLKRRNPWLIVVAFLLSAVYLHCYHTISQQHTDSLSRIIDAPFRTLCNVLSAWIAVAFGWYAYRLLNDGLLKANSLKLAAIGLSLCLVSFVSASFLPQWLEFCAGYLATLLGPLGLLLLAKSSQSSAWLCPLDWWGRNSLNLMVTHYSITLVLFKIVVTLWMNQPFYGWITVICFLLSMPVQYLFVAVVDRYCKFTLGK